MKLDVVVYISLRKYFDSKIMTILDGIAFNGFLAVQLFPQNHFSLRLEVSSLCGHYGVEIVFCKWCEGEKIPIHMQ